MGTKQMQEALPGVAPPQIEPPTGPLQYRVIEEKRVDSDDLPAVSVIAVLLPAFLSRHHEAGAFVGNAVRMAGKGEGAAEEVASCYKQMSSMSTQGSVKAKVWLKVGTEGHRWVGQYITIEKMQLELPFTDEETS